MFNRRLRVKPKYKEPYIEILRRQSTITEYYVKAFNEAWSEVKPGASEPRTQRSLAAPHCGEVRERSLERMKPVVESAILNPPSLID